MLTAPGVIGTNSSVLRVSVLWSLKLTAGLRPMVHGSREVDSQVELR